MGWTAIIAAILQLLGPVLVDWLKKWLDSLLKRAAARMPEVTAFASNSAAGVALCDAAIDMLPRWAFARRTMLRWARQAVSRRTFDGTDEHLAAWELAELSDAAQAAENE